MADELERRWRFYQYEKELTKKNERTQKFVVDVDDNNDIVVCNSKKTSKKNGLIGWADSR